MQLHIRIDDLSAPEAQALITERLAGMHANSPPGHVFALAFRRTLAADRGGAFLVTVADDSFHATSGSSL